MVKRSKERKAAKVRKKKVNTTGLAYEIREMMERIQMSNNKNYLDIAYNQERKRKKSDSVNYWCMLLLQKSGFLHQFVV